MRAQNSKKPRAESTEQVVFVNRVRQFYPDLLIFAIPNGGQRSITEAVRLKAEGVLAGVPDLFIAHPAGNKHGLFIEMKRADQKAAVSAKQAEAIATLCAAGYEARVAYGCEQAWQYMEQYLGHGQR